MPEDQKPIHGVRPGKPSAETFWMPLHSQDRQCTVIEGLNHAVAGQLQNPALWRQLFDSLVMLAVDGAAGTVQACQNTGGPGLMDTICAVGKTVMALNVLTQGAA